MTDDLPDEIGENPASTRKVPRRVVQALEARLTGRVNTWKAAAELVGIRPEYLSRMLAKGHVRAFYDRRSQEVLRDMRPEAIGVLRELMLNGKSERTRLTATDQAFKLLGMYPRDGAPSVNVNIEAPGYVIDLVGRRADERAPPMIEGDPIRSAADGGRDDAEADA